MSLKIPKREHDIGNVYLPMLSFMTVTLQTAAAETRCVLRVHSAARKLGKSVNLVKKTKLGKTFRNKMSVKSN